MAETGSIHNVAVIGVGGIGGLTGARLAAASPRNYRVTFIARGAHLEAIRSAGLRLLGPDGSSSIVRPDLATDRLEDIPSPDVVFVCVKGYDLTGVARRLAGLVRAETVVIPLLNGADIQERIRAEVKNGLVLPACIYVSSRMLEPGTVQHVGGKGLIHLGPDPARPEFRPEALQALLNEAGIPYEWHEDPLPAVWTKYLFIASFGLVTAAHRVSFGELLADERLTGQVRAVLEEIAAIAAARGVTLDPEAIENSFRIARAFPPETRTSYQRDVEARSAANEGDLFGGTILRLSRQHGVPVPVTEELSASVERYLSRT